MKNDSDIQAQTNNDLPSPTGDIPPAWLDPKTTKPFTHVKLHENGDEEYASLNEKDSREDYKPLLHHLIDGEKTQVLEEVLKAGADPNFVDEKQSGFYLQSPLYYATYKGKNAIVTLLVENKADPNLANANGGTPLHMAAHTNNSEIITTLVNHGADPSLQSKTGKIPLELLNQDNKQYQEMENLLKPASQVEPLLETVQVTRLETRNTQKENNQNAHEENAAQEKILENFAKKKNLQGDEKEKFKDNMREMLPENLNPKEFSEALLKAWNEQQTGGKINSKQNEKTLFKDIDKEERFIDLNEPSRTYKGPLAQLSDRFKNWTKDVKAVWNGEAESIKEAREKRTSSKDSMVMESEDKVSVTSGKSQTAPSKSDEPQKSSKIGKGAAIGALIGGIIGIGLAVVTFGISLIVAPAIGAAIGAGVGAIVDRVEASRAQESIAAPKIDKKPAKENTKEQTKEQTQDLSRSSDQNLDKNEVSTLSPETQQAAVQSGISMRKSGVNVTASDTNLNSVNAQSTPKTELPAVAVLKECLIMAATTDSPHLNTKIANHIKSNSGSLGFNITNDNLVCTCGNEKYFLPQKLVDNIMINKDKNPGNLNYQNVKNDLNEKTQSMNIN